MRACQQSNAWVYDGNAGDGDLRIAQLDGAAEQVKIRWGSQEAGRFWAQKAM